jgi:hypothetical protein
MTAYKLTDVKMVCQAVYGREISDRTWRRWKERLGFTGYEREVSEAKMQQLLTLANMKRTAPLSKISLGKVLKNKEESLRKLQGLIDSALLPEYCLGENLPGLLEDLTGRKPSLKTLYRWGASNDFRFQANKKYSKHEVQKWVDISTEYVAKNKSGT